ncbi:hypothetical protein WJS89_01025 [Sphingomicrobium sp. XHP0235]|uniref:hypothetical protein n=1 Tax=Sphingomicrobium aquimarinum TaxID=3133971 RepID=UPI0031FF081A
MIAAAFSIALACPAPEPMGLNRSAQVEAYAQRSIAIVKAAKALDREQIEEWVRPDAEFSYVTGGPTIMFASGFAGIADLAVLLNSSFVFDVRYEHHRTDPCGDYTIDIRFPDDDGSKTVTVEFSYEDGTLVSAVGTLRSTVTGSLEEVIN